MVNTPWKSPRARHILGESITDALAKAPNVVTAAYTPTKNDLIREIQVNSATAVTVTIPAGMRPNDKLRIVQVGTGLVTLAPGAGVTLNTPSTLKSNGRWSTIVVTYSTPTSAILSGLLAAA